MNLTKQLAAAAALFTFLSASAGNLWIIGEATPYGWSTDDATALLSTPESPDVFTGTIYLEADRNFKFMLTKDFGSDEYGMAVGATPADGVYPLAGGREDQGYEQLKVSESANYLISVNTTDMSASIVKSAYQDEPIKLASLFMVGSATEGGWSVDDGTPLYQIAETPYEFASNNVSLNAGTFKIATVIKGGGTWDNRYWYYRSTEDPAKIALGQAGDEQWTIDNGGYYDIKVNLQTSAISITESDDTGTLVINPSLDETPRYWTLDGVEVSNPTKGLYIRRIGDRVEKVIL